MSDCTCGWILSDQGNCANPDHDSESLKVAAEKALIFLAEKEDDEHMPVIFALAAALGKDLP